MAWWKKDLTSGNVDSESDTILEESQNDMIPKNSGSVILDDNELENFGETGQHLIERYLRPDTIFPEHLFKGVTPKLVDFLQHNITSEM